MPNAYLPELLSFTDAIDFHTLLPYCCRYTTFPACAGATYPLNAAACPSLIVVGASVAEIVGATSTVRSAVRVPIRSALPGNVSMNTDDTVGLYAMVGISPAPFVCFAASRVNLVEFFG